MRQRLWFCSLPLVLARFFAGLTVGLVMGGKVYFDELVGMEFQGK